MKTLYTLPPNYAAIQKAFNVRGKKVWFCYGSTIHNPSRTPIPPAIMCHEKVHSAQQRGDPGDWWDRYIASAKFRLSQEIPAHRAEYDHYRTHLLEGRELAATLDAIAQRLASPLYGNLIEVADARRIIGAWHGSSTASDTAPGTTRASTSL